jgi:hypothetical protein
MENKCNIKFSSLYNIIRNNDINKLDLFLSFNKDFDYNKLLNVGKRLKIYHQAIVSNNFDSFKVIIDYICKNDPHKYIDDILDHVSIAYNKDPQYYEYFYEKINELVYQDIIIINDDNHKENFYCKILFTILKINKIQDFSLLDKLLSNDKFNFIYLMNNDEFKDHFEIILSKCKTNIIKYFINYNELNNIDSLYIYLLFTSKIIHPTIKSKVNNMDWNTIVTKKINNTTISMPVGILYFLKSNKCNYKKLTKINNFEGELIKYFTCSLPDLFRSVIFYNLKEYCKNNRLYYNYPILDDIEFDILKSIKHLLSYKFYKLLTDNNIKNACFMKSTRLQNKINEIFL